jgi:signal peptidase I
MAGGRKGRVEILSERAKIPADGKTATKLCIRFPEPPGEEITLRLTRRGSFEPDAVVREASFRVVDGEVSLSVYAPTRPGAGFLFGEGFKHRLDFVAASFMQGLIFEWVPTLFWAVLFALILRTYAVASFFIPSGSMEDTLLEHDLLIADKLSYKVLRRDPARGDIMIFQFPENRRLDYIKRVIGLPGETIEVEDGVVFVDAEPLSEKYIKEQPLLDYGPFTVPADHYFMMGDNRNHSQDSRVWGTVPRSYFEGRALFIFYPFNRVRPIRNGRPGLGAALAADGS